MPLNGEVTAARWPSLSPRKTLGSCATQSSYRVDPCKKACFSVGQTAGNRGRNCRDHFRRALSRTSFAKPPTFADAICWFPVHALVSL